MGKSSPKAPAAPDPVATANAQTASNKETALWNAALSNVNQMTPYGNLVYTKTGGSSTEPPQYTATTTLTPEQQKVLSNQNAFDIGTSKLGADQVSRVAQALAAPVDYSGLPKAPGTDDFSADRDKITDSLYGQYTRSLDPQWQQEKTAFDSQMYAKGIQPGSEAYKTAYDDFNRSKNDAYGAARSQAVGAGGAEQSRLFGLGTSAHQQAVQDYLSQREQPLNEATALMSGSQVSQPNFSNISMPSAQAGDVQGATYNSYQGALNNYNQQLASSNATKGGLFGLAGTGLSLGLQAAFPQTFGAGAILAALGSDERLKENIELVGEEKGFKIYAFNYRKDPAKVRLTGVMAHEVIKVRPDAVTFSGNGNMFVNYDKLGLEMRRAA